jgi:peptidoglycan/xylan/chitin deacetylase (PgdA/CDA1 family)
MQLSVRTRGVEARVVVGCALVLSMFVGIACTSLPPGGTAAASGRPGASAGQSAAETATAPAVASQADASANARPGDGSPNPAGPNQSSVPAGSSGSVTLPPVLATPTGSAAPIASETPSRPPVSSTPETRPDPNRVYQVPVLMYHRVVPLAEAGGLQNGLIVPPETFTAQLKALFDAGWHSITMATLADRMAQDSTIPPKTFVLTFDDGWEDGYIYAFPIMRQFGFVGTFFVISSRIDTKDSLSTQEMRTLEAAGNEIGNHTENHVSLSTVTMSRVKDEVENASEAIARAVGHRPVSLSYPMGGVSDAVVWVVGQIPDIKIAVTTVRGKTETWPSRYATPRMRVNPTTDPARLVPWISP